MRDPNDERQGELVGLMVVAREAMADLRLAANTMRHHGMVNRAERLERLLFSINHNLDGDIRRGLAVTGGLAMAWEETGIETPFGVGKRVETESRRGSQVAKRAPLKAAEPGQD